MDKLVLKSCKFYGYHGVNDEEKVIGQPYIIDLELYLKDRIAINEDTLENAVDYSKVYAILEDYVENKSFKLVEFLAESITIEILEQFKIIQGVKICIKKPQAKLIGKYDYISFEIERFRD